MIWLPSRCRRTSSACKSPKPHSDSSDRVLALFSKTIFTVCAIFTVAVNKQELVKLDGAFGPEALRILRDVPGLTVIRREPPAANHRVDAIIQFAGAHNRVAVEIKKRANAATAWQLIQSAASNPDTPLFLIAGETTAEARRILERHGIAVVDGLGNAHIELPGLLLHLEGRKQSRRFATGRPPTRLSGKTGVAAQALLLESERLWRVGDLAKKAEVSTGLAHRVLTRLEAEGVLEREGSGPNVVRRVTNPTALLDLWAEENVERSRRTLGFVLASNPEQLVTELGANLESSGIRYAVTGAAASMWVAPFITAIPVVNVWVSAAAAPEELCEGVRADQVDNGQNVVFLQSKDDAPLVFRQKIRRLWVVNRFRLYVDLRRDPRRGREQSDHIRKEVIGF